jgi:hypothetical protein
MGTLAQIRTALSTAADTTTGLRAYPYMPVKPELPALVVGWPSTFDPHQLEVDGTDYQIPCYLLVPFRQDRSADAALTGFLATSGGGSVIASLESSQTLGGVCDSASVLEVNSINQTTLGDGVTDVLVATIVVEVLA